MFEEKKEKKNSLVQLALASIIGTFFFSFSIVHGATLFDTGTLANGSTRSNTGGFISLATSSDAHISSVSLKIFNTSYSATGTWTLWLGTAENNFTSLASSTISWFASTTQNVSGTIPGGTFSNWASVGWTQVSLSNPSLVPFQKKLVYKFLLENGGTVSVNSALGGSGEPQDCPITGTCTTSTQMAFKVEGASSVPTIELITPPNGEAGPEDFDWKVRTFNTATSTNGASLYYAMYVYYGMTSSTMGFSDGSGVLSYQSLNSAGQDTVIVKTKNLSSFAPTYSPTSTFYAQAKLFQVNNMNGQYESSIIAQSGITEFQFTNESFNPAWEPSSTINNGCGYAPENILDVGRGLSYGLCRFVQGLNTIKQGNLEFLKQSWTETKTKFPFIVFTQLTDEAIAQSAVVASSTTDKSFVITFGNPWNITVPVLTSSTLVNIMGQQNKDDFFTYLRNLTYLSTAVIALIIISL